MVVRIRRSSLLYEARMKSGEILSMTIRLGRLTGQPDEVVQLGSGFCWIFKLTSLGECQK